ncbi:hypothetical protein [Capnocytophaga stomatis]|uniref:hypothetical protein n=1 Tax=Capnocytophaga stomatis TaxID=1848904 RepID=UPI001BB439AE|nr:hypothetical protein [Capnocytophaga stomatis]
MYFTAKSIPNKLFFYRKSLHFLSYEHNSLINLLHLPLYGLHIALYALHFLLYRLHFTLYEVYFHLYGLYFVLYN